MRPGASLRLSAAVTLAAAVPGAAFAAEGMPQLNFANPLTFGQAVWMLVIFFVLYILVKDWGLPQVATVIESRNASIQGDLDTARLAMQKADAASAEVAKQTAEARAEAQGRINAAMDEAKQRAAAQAAEINARLDAQLAESEAQITRARANAMGALREVATDTTQLIIDRLLGVQASRQSVEQAVGHALAASGRG